MSFPFIVHKPIISQSDPLNLQYVSHTEPLLTFLLLPLKPKPWFPLPWSSLSPPAYSYFYPNHTDPIPDP